MNIIIEGPDRTGKDSAIEGIRGTFVDDPMIVLKSSCLPRTTKISSEKEYEYYVKYYTKMLRLMQDEDNLIFNRSHIGELVYGNLYRKYSGDYVLDLEKQFNLSNCVLFLLYDEPETLAARDDGLAHSANPENIRKEIALFREAVKRTSIPHVFEIDCKGKSKSEVLLEIVLQLTKIDNNKAK